MKASELVKQLIPLIEKFGDLEIVIDVISEGQVLETTDLLEWDTFEPGHPGYFLLETVKDEI